MNRGKAVRLGLGISGVLLVISAFLLASGIGLFLAPGVSASPDSWTVSSQTDWEDNTDSAESENERIVDGTLGLGGYWWVAGGYDNLYKYDSDWNYTGTKVNISEVSYAYGLWRVSDNWWVSGNNENVFKYDSNWNYTGETHDISPTDSSIFYDGSNWWSLDPAGDKVYKWDSNWNYLDNVSVAATPYGVFFRSDDNRHVLCEGPDDVIRYDNQWNQQDNFSVADQDANGRDIFFTEFGYWWFSGNDTDNVYRYGVDGTYTGETHDLSSELVAPMEIYRDLHPSALWVQKSHQYSSAQVIENITMSVDNLGGGLSVKVQTSDDNFSTVKGDTGWMSVTTTGTVTKTIGDISGEYMRVKYDLTRGSTPSVNDYTVNSSTANRAPVAEDLYTTTPMDPNSAYDYEVEVSDQDGLSDIENITLTIYENTLAPSDSDNARNHYTFLWENGAGFSELGPDTGEAHLNVASCAAGSDAATTDNWIFNITLSKIAKPTGWDGFIEVNDYGGAQDNKELANEFSVNIYHSVSFENENITFRGSPEEQDVGAEENPNTVTIDTNETVDLEYKYSGPFTNENENIYVDKDGATPYDVTISTSYQKLYTGITYGAGITKSEYWFIDIPTDVSTSTTIFYTRVVSG